MVARTRKANISILQIADACEVAPFLVRRWFHRIIGRLGLEPPEERTPMHIVDDCVCKLLSEAAYNEHKVKQEAKNAKEEEKVAKVLEEDEVDLLKSDSAEVAQEWDGIDGLTQLGKLRQRVSTAIHRILQMASEQLLVTGRQPGPIAAAATLLVLKAFPDTAPYAKLEELLPLVNASKHTINLRTTEFKSLLLKQAIATLPWTANLSLSNLEERLPMIVNHLEIEARVQAAKSKLEAQKEAATAAVHTGALLPTVMSSSKKARDQETSSVPPSPMQRTLAPAPHPSISFEPASLTGSLLIQAPQPDFESAAPHSRHDRVKLEVSDELSLSSSTSTMPSSSSTASSTMDTTSSSESAETPAIAKYAVRLGPSALSRFYPSEPASTPAPEPNAPTSSSAPLQASLVLVKPELGADGTPLGASNDSSGSMDVDKKPMGLPLPPSGRRSKLKDQKHHPRVLARSFAPAFLKSEALKARRAHSIRKVRRRLALLAHSLPAEQASEFGLAKFRDLPIEEEDEVEEVLTGQALKTAEEEENQIERLLMDGASDDQIMTGYLGIQLEALDSHYNAVTEQYTNYTDALIRSPSEIAILEQMKSDMGYDS